jgi:hypothetical protein
MKDFNDIKEILSKISEMRNNNEIGYGEYIDFNNDLLKKCFPSDEKIDDVFFGTNRITISTRNVKTNEYTTYTNHVVTKYNKYITTEMYNIIYDELYRIYQNYVDITNKIQDIDDDKLHEFVVENIVKPTMKRMYAIYKNNINRERRYYAMRNYSGTPKVSVGGRTCDCGRKYKAIIIYDCDGSYCGGFEFSKTQMRHFAPLCGECSYSFNTNNIIYIVEEVVKWICS